MRDEDNRPWSSARGSALSTSENETAAELESIVDTAIAAAEDKLGDRAVAFQVGEVLGITDWFVVASGSSRRQVRAIVENIEEWLYLEHGLKPRRIEGLDSATRASGRYADDGSDALAWVLMDYGVIVVHLFDTEAREYYDLERLWQDVPQRTGAGAVSE